MSRQQQTSEGVLVVEACLRACAPPLGKEITVTAENDV